MSNFIPDVIGLKDENVVIDDYTINEETKERITSVSLKRIVQACPECGSASTIIHSNRTKKIVHSYATDFPCTILYKQRRLLCKDCHATFIEPNNFVLGYNHLSDLTISRIFKDLKTTDSYINIANRYNISSQTVLNYMDRFICPKRRTLPEIICIDEFKNLSFGKGKYACLLINYQTGEIIDVLPNRQLEYLQYYFNHISNKEKDNVKYIVSDMYEPYKHLATCTFHNVTLVIDAFHYIRYVSEAFNKVRIRVMKTFKTNSTEYKLLKKYWKILSKDSNKLEHISVPRKWSYIEEEISLHDLINRLKKIHPDIEQAYLMKEDFFASYRKIDYKKADVYLQTIINSMSNTNLEEFIEVSKTFKNWFPYIVNSFMKDVKGRRMSNGVIEGSNNKIKVIKRVSYGYGDFYHLRNRIMYVFNDNETTLPIPLSPKQIKDAKFGLYKERNLSQDE